MSRSFLTGAVVGAIATIGAVWLWMPSTTRSGASAPNTQTQALALATTTVAVAPPPTAPSTTPSPVSVTSTAPTVAAAPASSPPTTPAKASPAVAVPTPPPVPAVPGIALSAEHARMLSDEGGGPNRRLTMPELHAKLATETPDLAWAQTMERDIRQFIAAQPNANQYEVVGVICRATLCELQAFGNVPRAGEGWSAIVQGMSKQPWWAFTGVSSSATEQNGRTVLLTILQRGKA